MLDTRQITTVAAIAALTLTVAGCSNREKPDGTSTGSAYIRTPEGSYVPTPAETAGITTPRPAPGNGTAAPSNANPKSALPR
jgi:hypothetical protein